jgi:aspartate/methionine/tyrosine aminotransferase
MHITPFAVEMWMNAHETRCTLNLAETCVDSLTVAQLLDLAGANAGDLSALLPMKLTYGEIPGSDRLRDAIAGLYDRQARDNVVVTHGTIGANALVHQALVGRGDRVVAVVPTYQQHYSIPDALGAEVVPLHLRPENGWLPDMEELARLATPGTRLIALANPNNPTGALIDRAGLEQIAEIARRAGAWVLCDEVYRGTDQDGPGATASMADVYEKGISTAGMSKAFSLAGLRLGWVVAPPEVTEAVMIHRDYTTISVGMIDDHLAAMALGAKDRVLGRSRAITRTNLAILSDWVAGEPRASFVRPRSGTTAFVRLDIPIGSEDFCKALLAETGVLFTPGAAFDIEGHVRLGYACATDVLREGLARTSAFLGRIRT